MKTNPREILLYYNSTSSSDRKTLAMAMSVSKHVRSYDHARAPGTTTTWKMILSKLDVHPKSLMNKAHPDYQNNIRGKELNYEGWLQVLMRNPQLIKAPIAIKGNQVQLCETPTDVYKLA